MSGFRPVATELLYAFYGAATVSTPTVSPGSSMILTYPPIQVPAGYMANAGSWSSSLRLKMGGLLTCTATIPTWQFFLYAQVATTTAPVFATGGITIASTGTFTPSAATANVPWFLEVDIGLRTLALGAASTIVGFGEWRCDSFASTAYAVATPFEQTMPANGAYTPPATWDNTQTYTIWPALSLGAATAGNTVTTQFLKLYGEN